jgi:hypothetical protein
MYQSRYFIFHYKSYRCLLLVLACFSGRAFKSHVTPRASAVTRGMSQYQARLFSPPCPPSAFTNLALTEHGSPESALALALSRSRLASHAPHHACGGLSIISRFITASPQHIWRACAFFFYFSIRRFSFILFHIHQLH